MGYKIIDFFQINSSNIFHSQPLESAFIDEWFYDATTIQKRIVELAKEDKINFEKSEKEFRWHLLEQWTAMACRYLNGSEYNGDNWEMKELQNESTRLMRSYLLNHYAVLTPDEIVEGLILNNSALSSCQKEMIKTILNAKGPIDAQWLIDKLDYARSGGKAGEIFRKFINELSNTIRDGTALIVHGITKPFIYLAENLSIPSSQSQSSQSQSSGNSQSQSSHQSSGYHDPGGLAHDQLRGISSGNDKIWDGK